MGDQMDGGRPTADEVSAAVSRLAALPAPEADPLDAEIERLRTALEAIAALPDVRCDEAPCVARNALNRETRAVPVEMPAWDAPYNRYYAPVEELATQIYAKFEYNAPGRKPRWTPHGNATMQDHARSLARQQLRSSKPDIAHG